MCCWICDLYAPYQVFKHGQSEAIWWNSITAFPCKRCCRRPGRPTCATLRRAYRAGRVDAAASLRERLEETLRVLVLGLPTRLQPPHPQLSAPDVATLVVYLKIL